MSSLKLSFMISIIVTIVFASSVYSKSNEASAEKTNSGSSMMGMCSANMNKAPKDVIIKPASSQVVQVGKEAKITILVTDKTSKKPLLDADVPIMIERGPSMSTGDMVGQMFSAEEIGSGKYLVKFTPDKKGIYTIHTHVIPPGKSMMSMMSNHMDIGIITK